MAHGPSFVSCQAPPVPEVTSRSEGARAAIDFALPEALGVEVFGVDGVLCSRRGPTPASETPASGLARENTTAAPGRQGAGEAEGDAAPVGRTSHPALAIRRPAADWRNRAASKFGM